MGEGPAPQPLTAPVEIMSRLFRNVHHRPPKPAVPAVWRSAKLARFSLRLLTPLAALHGIIHLRTLPSSVCLGRIVMLPKPELAYFASADISGYRASSRGSNWTMRRTSSPISWTRWSRAFDRPSDLPSLRAMLPSSTRWPRRSTARSYRTDRVGLFQVPAPAARRQAGIYL